MTKENLISDPQNLHSVILIKDIWNAPRVEYPQQIWDQGIRMMLDVPLAIEDQLVGLIRIYLDKQREFTDSELDFIVTVAEQCAGIIERVQLLENHQARFTHMATHVDKLSISGTDGRRHGPRNQQSPDRNSAFQLQYEQKSTGRRPAPRGAATLS